MSSLRASRRWLKCTDIKTTACQRSLPVAIQQCDTELSIWELYVKCEGGTCFISVVIAWFLYLGVHVSPQLSPSYFQFDAKSI